MTDKKKPFSLETASLETLTGLSSMAELREQMDELTRPSYLAGLQAQMAELTRPSYLADLQAQMAELTQPSYLADLQAQMAELTQPSYLADLQAQMAELTRPSYLMDLQAQMAELTRPSYLTDLEAHMAELKRPSYPADLQLQLAELTDPSYMTDLKAQMAELTRPSYLADLQVQMAELTRPSYLDELQNQVATMVGGARMQAELAAVADSYQNLISGSVLASYLVAPDARSEPGTKVLRVESFDSLDFGDFAMLEVDPVSSVDREIVKAISAGEVTKLSPTAAQRLHSVYLQIVVFWDMLLRIFNTYMAYAFLTALLSVSSVPADIPLQAAALNNEQRELLSDYRIVNREGARLREEPTTQSKAITSLPFAHLVEVIEYNDKGWYRVVAETPKGDLEGWMYVSVTTPIPKPKPEGGQKVDVDAI